MTGGVVFSFGSLVARFHEFQECTGNWFPSRGLQISYNACVSDLRFSDIPNWVFKCGFR